MSDANPPDSPPTPPEKKSPLGQIVGLVLFVAVVLNALVTGFGGLFGLFFLSMGLGVGLLFTKHKRIGKILLISGLVVAILGLGTCALLISNMGGGH